MLWGQWGCLCAPLSSPTAASVASESSPAGPQSRAGSTQVTGAQGESSPARRRGSWALRRPQVVPVSVSHRMRTRTRNPQHTGGNNPRACPMCLFPRGSAERREGRRGQDTASLTAGGPASLRLLRLSPSPHCARGAPCSHERLPTCLPRFLLENSRETFFNSASYFLNPFLQKIQRELIKTTGSGPCLLSPLSGAHECRETQGPGRWGRRSLSGPTLWWGVLTERPSAPRTRCV